MGNEAPLLNILTGLIDELRDVAKDLTRVGNHLDGESRDHVREVQCRVEAMRRYYEYLGSALANVQAAGDDGPRPILKPAANADP